MTVPHLCRLAGRGLVSLVGPDADAFLARMITQSPTVADDDHAGYGALLTPQGKILADFLIVREPDAILLDCPAAVTADLVKRLTMFRLRSAVDIADASRARMVVALWGDGEAAALPAPIHAVRDPRHPDLGARAYPASDAEIAFTATNEDWQNHRIALAVPELGVDAQPGDCFPHDIAMDCLHGIDFDKGCYVGQEVVSRMRYRGTARRRPLAVVIDNGADDGVLRAGDEIVANGRSLGAITSASGSRGLGLFRVDRVADAVAAGPATVSGRTVRLDLPGWANYGWPDENAPATP